MNKVKTFLTSLGFLAVLTACGARSIPNARWYPDLPQTSGMETSMGAMNVSEGTELYDVRFIAAMIPHHESAITMAQQAVQRAEHPELKKLAEAIITAQTAEITQMKQWYQTWTGKPYTGAA